jgi:hypothetical protein
MKKSLLGKKKVWQDWLLVWREFLQTLDHFSLRRSSPLKLAEQNILKVFITSMKLIFDGSNVKYVMQVKTIYKLKI